MGSGCNGLNTSKSILAKSQFSGVGQCEDLCGLEYGPLVQGTGQGGDGAGARIHGTGQRGRDKNVGL